MELEELSDIETKSGVLLCKTCKEQGEYNIPLLELNKFNKIEYKCIKRHKIDRTKISYELVNEEIKKNLTRCKIKEHFDVHQGQPSVFCAFSEIPEKNICQFGVGDYLKGGHNYILYMAIMPEFKYKNELEQKLERLKELIYIYKDIYPSEIDEIKFLIRMYNRRFMNYNLYYNEKINNYQTIKNLPFNYYDNLVLEKYENNINKDRYKFLYKEILSTKPLNEINKIELNMTKKESEKLAILIKDNDINEEKKIYFCILTEKLLKIYDIDGNIKNEINLEYNYDFLFTLFDNNKIILKTFDNLVLLYLSDNFNIYMRINLNFYQHRSFMEHNFDLINLYHMYNNIKFLKTSSNQFIFINEGKAYIANSSSTITKENDLLNFFGVCDVKQNNDEFDSKHSPESSDDLNSVKKYKYILKGNSAYYKDDNNNILEGIIIISILVNKYGYFTRISYQSKIIMFDENLKKRFEIGFQYSFNCHDRIRLLEIIYNY